MIVVECWLLPSMNRAVLVSSYIIEAIEFRDYCLSMFFGLFDHYYGFIVWLSKVIIYLITLLSLSSSLCFPLFYSIRWTAVDGFLMVFSSKKQLRNVFFPFLLFNTFQMFVREQMSNSLWIMKERKENVWTTELDKCNK